MSRVSSAAATQVLIRPASDLLDRLPLPLLQHHVLPWLTSQELASLARTGSSMAALMRLQGSWRGCFVNEFATEPGILDRLKGMQLPSTTSTPPPAADLLPMDSIAFIESPVSYPVVPLPVAPAAASAALAKGSVLQWKDMCQAASKSLEKFEDVETWCQLCYPSLVSLFHAGSTQPSAFEGHKAREKRWAALLGEPFDLEDEDGEERETLLQRNSHGVALESVEILSLDATPNAFEAADPAGLDKADARASDQEALHTERQSSGEGDERKSPSQDTLSVSEYRQQPMLRLRRRMAKRVARFLFLHRRKLPSKALSNFLCSTYLQFRYGGGRKSGVSEEYKTAHRESSVLYQYLDLFNWRGLDLEAGVRALTSLISLPSSGRALQSLLSCFAHSYFAQNQPVPPEAHLASPELASLYPRMIQSHPAGSSYPDKLLFTCGDAIYRLTYCLLVLNTDQHALGLKERMYGLGAVTAMPPTKHHRMTPEQWSASTLGTRNDIPQGFACSEPEFVDRMHEIYLSIQRYPMIPLSSPVRSTSSLLAEWDDSLAALTQQLLPEVAAPAPASRNISSWSSSLRGFFSRPFFRQQYRRVVCTLHQGVLTISEEVAQRKQQEATGPVYRFDLRTCCPCGQCATLPTMKNALRASAVVADGAEGESNGRQFAFAVRVASVSSDDGEAEATSSEPRELTVNFHSETLRDRDEWLAHLYWHVRFEHMGRFASSLFSRMISQAAAPPSGMVDMLFDQPPS